MNFLLIFMALSWGDAVPVAGMGASRNWSEVRVVPCRVALEVMTSVRSSAPARESFRFIFMNLINGQR